MERSWILPHTDDASQLQNYHGRSRKINGQTLVITSAYHSAAYNASIGVEKSTSIR